MAAKFKLNFILICAIGLFSFCPNFVSAYSLHVLIIGIYYAVMALAWNFLAGQAGLLVFSQAAFAAMGAYASGLFILHSGCPIWSGLIFATAVTGIVGALLGALCRKLNGTYLALVTLSFAEIVRIVITNEDRWTRGTFGLQVPGLLTEYSKVHYFYLFLSLFVIVLFGSKWIGRSRFGFKMLAIKDDSDAAESLGINTARVRTIAFALSAMASGLAGATYAHYLGLATPEMGSLGEMFLILSMTYVGGIGTSVGPAVGAIVLEVAYEQLRDFGQYHLLVFAALTLFVVRFMPAGFSSLVGVFRTLKKDPESKATT